VLGPQARDHIGATSRLARAISGIRHRIVGQDRLVSISAAQADAFYSEAIAQRCVWAIRDAEGFPAPVNGDGLRAMPFWSLRSRAERVVSQVPAYAAFEPVEINLEQWRTDWLTGLDRDGLLVGLNWSGDRATGYDVTPAEVLSALAARATTLD
jgi:hypothetical protein